MVKKRRSIKHILGATIAAFGLLLFMGGLYLLPIGTDAFLYFWVEVVAHGNWILGDIYANGFALLMIVVGLVMMMYEGVKPGLKKGGKK